MPIPIRQKLGEYQIDKLGSVATLRQYAENGTDAYGDTAYTTTDTELTVIISTVTNTRMPFVRQGVLGHYLMMQVEFFTTDDLVPPNTAVAKPPVLIHNGLEYEITEIEDAGIGLIRLIGYRERK